MCCGWERTRPDLATQVVGGVSGFPDGPSDFDRPADGRVPAVRRYRGAGGSAGAAEGGGGTWGAEDGSGGASDGNEGADDGSGGGSGGVSVVVVVVVAVVVESEGVVVVGVALTIPPGL